MRQTLLVVVGIACFVFGLFFMLQGLGLVRWPSSSTMLSSDVWVLRGGLIAMLGAILVAGARLAPGRGRASNGNPKS